MKRSAGLAIILASVLLSGCATLPETPRSVTEHVFESIRKGNIDAVWNRMSNADKQGVMKDIGGGEAEAKAALAKMYASPGAQFNFVRTKILDETADSATLAVTIYTLPYQRKDQTTVHLVREDGKWLMKEEWK